MKIYRFIIFIFVLLAGLDANAQKVVFTDAAKFPLYGKISDKTNNRYERLPANLEGVSRKDVWKLGLNSSGLYIRFRSNSTSQKMLVALQNRSIVPLGSDEAVAVDIRLIAATNRDLFKMVGEGDFRQDLLYRINTIHIELPPLRQRKEDILPLAEIFLTRYANRYNKGELRFTEEAQQALKEYVWEGNIRELQHTVEKAVIMAENRDVDVEQLCLQPIAPSPQKAEGSTLEEMERRMISEAIASSDGNMTTVAQQLGISRQTLYNKIKRYGL